MSLQAYKYTLKTGFVTNCNNKVFFVEQVIRAHMKEGFGTCLNVDMWRDHVTLPSTS